MKFPSLNKLAQESGAVIERYPFEIAFAFMGSFAATVNIELQHLQHEAANWCARIMMVSNIGLLLTFSAGLFGRSNNYPENKINQLKLLASAFAIAFIFVLDPLNRQMDYLRFFLLSMAFHLLVSFAAFLNRRNVMGFWQFNRTLFLRFLAAALYSGVLYLGLSAAIGSMNFLFNFQFGGDTFGILFVWIAGLFQTIFFLAGVPTNFDALEEDSSYPKGLKVFTQYVLIPLASVYVVILIAYELKILLEWNLPKGLVSNLVLGYAVFGILALLLVYPVRNLEENKWIKTYSKSFYFLLVPLIALLFVAIGSRVLKYGITEDRYFLIALALWLSGITAYFLVSGKQNIKLIPISLAVVALLSAYGPQGAFSISKFSQQNRLKNHLATKPSEANSREIENVASYLIKHHGLEALQPFVKADVQNVKRHFEAKVGKMKDDGEKYQSYTAVSDAQDSIIKQISPDYKIKQDWTVSVESENFKNEELRVLNIGYPATVVEIGMGIADVTRFNVGSKTGIIRVAKNGKYNISIGTSSLNYDPLPLLKSAIRKKSSYLKAEDTTEFLAPNTDMQDTLQLVGQKIIVRFNYIGGGYREAKKKGLYVATSSGYLIVTR